MSSTYSSSLRVELIGSGDQAGAWGATTDNSFAYVFDTAIAGYQAVPITSTSQALTYVNGATATANLNQAVYAMLKFTGASAATSVYIPPSSKQYIVWNNTSYAITVYNSTVIGNTTAAGTGITLAAADKILIWSDGTNVYDVKAQGLTGTLAIANGGTGQVTANAAFNALAPAQTAATTTNKYLKSDGTNTSWDLINLSSTTTVTAGSFVVGTSYTILSIGTTDFTLIGAASNTVGVVFTATGVGAGTGTAYVADYEGVLPVIAGGTGVTTSTGSGNNVLSTSPTITSATLVTPALGTPTSGTLTSCTFPILNQNTTGTAAGLSATLAITSGGTGQTTQQAAINALAGTQTNNRVLRSDGTNTTLSQVALATDVSGTLPIANGGTGQTTAQSAMNAFAGAVTSGSYLRGNGTNVSMSAIQAADVPILNQNTSGTAAGLSATLAIASGGTGQTTAANAGSAFGAIGVGQSWQTPSRANATTYTNSTGRPIFVAISGGSTTNNGFILTIDGVNVAYSEWLSLAGGVVVGTTCGIVPASGTYSVAGWGSTSSGAAWAELR